MKTLDSLKIGECACVKNLNTIGSLRKRFRDLGLSDGATVFCTGQSTHRDISSYLIKGAVIAIRCDDAKTVIIQ